MKRSWLPRLCAQRDSGGKSCTSAPASCGASSRYVAADSLTTQPQRVAGCVERRSVKFRPFSCCFGFFCRVGVSWRH